MFRSWMSQLDSFGNYQILEFKGRDEKVIRDDMEWLSINLTFTLFEQIILMTKRQGKNIFILGREWRELYLDELRRVFFDH